MYKKIVLNLQKIKYYSNNFLSTQLGKVKHLLFILVNYYPWLNEGKTVTLLDQVLF